MVTSEKKSWLHWKWVERGRIKPWDKIKIYCSIDIIPEFPIEEISALLLAKMFNRAILSPEHCLKGRMNALSNYAIHYKVVIFDFSDTGEGKIKSVVLKTMNFREENNHHVRPAQPDNENGHGKFRSESMKRIYIYIKFLKKVLHLNLSSFWVKKELMKEQYSSIVDSCDNEDTALVQIISQPEFRSKVAHKIDIQKSNSSGCIHLTRETLCLPEVPCLGRLSFV